MELDYGGIDQQVRKLWNQSGLADSLGFKQETMQGLLQHMNDLYKTHGSDALETELGRYKSIGAKGPVSSTKSSKRNLNNIKRYAGGPTKRQSIFNEVEETTPTKDAGGDFLTSQWNKGVHESNESNPFSHDSPEEKKILARKRLIEKGLIPAMGTTNSTKEDWDVWSQKREEKELRKENQKIGARELRQKKEAREEQKKKEAEAAKAKTEAEAKAKAEKATAKRNAWAENHVKRKYADTKSSVKSANKEEFKKTLKNGFEEQLSEYKRAENKRSLLKRAWSRITHPFLSKEQRAIKQFAKDYGFDMRRHRSGKFGKVLDSFFKKRDYSIEKLQKQYTKAFIKENNEMLREQGAMEKTGRNSLHVLSDKMKEHGGRISKPGGKGFFGGKGGKVAMMAGLVGLGAVISNMFSGGHQSNSQLYNPNPQPQYYS